MTPQLNNKLNKLLVVVIFPHYLTYVGNKVKYSIIEMALIWQIEFFGLNIGVLQGIWEKALACFTHSLTHSPFMTITRLLLLPTIIIIIIILMK